MKLEAVLVIVERTYKRSPIEIEERLQKTVKKETTVEKSYFSDFCIGKLKSNNSLGWISKPLASSIIV